MLIPVSDIKIWGANLLLGVNVRLRNVGWRCSGGHCGCGAGAVKDRYPRLRALLIWPDNLILITSTIREVIPIRYSRWLSCFTRAEFWVSPVAAIRECVTEPCILAIRDMLKKKGMET